MVVAAGALAASVGSASADPSSNVLVTATVYASTGTSSDSVTVGALEANESQCPLYQGGQDMNELGRQGFVDVPLAPDATWSLPTILGCLQTPIPIGAVTGVTVMGANGTPEVGPGSQLTAADLAPSGSDFANAAEYPVVQALGSLNQYDRPWRGSGPGQPDDDFLDEVQATQEDQPAPVAIEVFEGPRLTVTATASRTTVPAGGTVTFTATVSGEGNSGLTYNWNFGGGAPNSTATDPEVRFRAAGEYEVALQVRDSAGGGGAAEIAITVGSAAPARTGGHRQTGSGTSRGSHSATGPRNSSGNRAGGAAGNRTSSSAGSQTSGSTATSPSSTPTSSSPPTTSHSTPRRATPVTTATRRAFGPLIRGQLVGDVTPVAPGASPLVRTVDASVASAPPARQAVRTSPLVALASGLGIIALLGLGAERELRGRRSWRALRPTS